MSDHFPVLVVALPFLAAFLLPAFSGRARRAGQALAVGTVAVVDLMLLHIFARVCLDGREMVYAMGAVDPVRYAPAGLAFPLRIVFNVDAFGAFMALVAGFVALCSVLYALHFMAEAKRQPYYYAVKMLMLAGMLGLCFTGDLFNFFVFLEIISIGAAALVAYRSDRAHPPYAGFKYMLISAVATTFFLVGIGLLYAQYGSFNMRYLHQVLAATQLDRIALVLMLVPLAMKCGAIPMHMWVPDTYGEAPAPVTALVMVASQTSLYGLFRLAFTLFGAPLPAASTLFGYPALGAGIIFLGALSMFIGVTMAIIQDDVMRLMAFHSVSQTGYMLVGIGVGLALHAAPDGGVAFADYGRTAMTGGIFHILNNALYKGLLFLTAGVMAARYGTRNLNRMIGLAHHDRFTTVVFIIGALAIAGIPPFNGFASKLIIYQSVFRYSPLLAMLAIFVSVLTLVSFVKVFYGSFLGVRRDDLVRPFTLSAGMKTAMGIMALVIVALGIWPDLAVRHLIGPAVASLVPGAAPPPGSVAAAPGQIMACIYWHPGVWLALLFTILALVLVWVRIAFRRDRDVPPGLAKPYNSGDLQDIDQGIGAHNLYWGFKEAIRPYLSLTAGMHDGDLNGYLIWLAVVMAAGLTLVGGGWL